MPKGDRLLGRGKVWELWWRQASEGKQLRVTLEDILEAARDQRQQESSRRYEVKGGGGGGGVDRGG